MLFILCLLSLVVASAETTCSDLYYQCVTGTSGGWFSSAYRKVVGEDVCLDFFKACKSFKHLESGM